MHHKYGMTDKSTRVCTVFFGQSGMFFLILITLEWFKFHASNM